MGLLTDLPAELLVSACTNAAIFATCKTLHDVRKRDPRVSDKVLMAQCVEHVLDGLECFFVEVAEEVAWDVFAECVGGFVMYGEVMTSGHMKCTSVGIFRLLHLVNTVTSELVKRGVDVQTAQTWRNLVETRLTCDMLQPWREYLTKQATVHLCKCACSRGRMDIVLACADALGHVKFVASLGPAIHAVVAEGLRGPHFADAIRTFKSIDWKYASAITYETDSSEYMDIRRFNALTRAGECGMRLVAQWLHDVYRNPRAEPAADMVLMACLMTPRGALLTPVGTRLMNCIVAATMRCAAHREVLHVLRVIHHIDALHVVGSLVQMYDVTFVDVPRVHTLMLNGASASQLLQVMVRAPSAAWCCPLLDQRHCRAIRLVLGLTPGRMLPHVEMDKSMLMRIGLLKEVVRRKVEK